MSFGAKKVHTILLASVIASFVLLGSFGPPHFSMAMTMDEHGTMEMSDCFMPGMTTLCQMDVFDHMTWWQSIFTSTPVQNLTVSLLLLMFAAGALLVWIRHAHSPPRRIFTRLKPRYQNYIPAASPLQELFSNGILNPKLF